MKVRFWLSVVLVVGLCNLSEFRLAADETEKKSDTTTQEDRAKEKDESKSEEKKPDLMTLLRSGPIDAADGR